MGNSRFLLQELTGVKIVSVSILILDFIQRILILARIALIVVLGIPITMNRSWELS